MLTCKKCGKSFDLEDYRDPSEMNSEFCPDCANELNDSEFDPMENEGRFENDAVGILEDELSPAELDDVLSGPDDDEIEGTLDDEEQDPDGEQPPWEDDGDEEYDDSGDADRDDF